ncbi:MAG: DUF2058 family protein [Thiothrix sp.]|nr:DUF2058 family protein [Thiothrix sp.]HPQ94407.1 DUF2058 family protein [Thiolinea sp.]
MSNSLSEQLLKAGLITQNQIDQAAQEKQQRKEKARAGRADKAGRPTQKGKHNRSGPASRSGPAAAANAPAADQSSAPEVPKPARPRKQPSDLAQFYKERAELERNEREAEEKRRREMAERKRKTRKQVRDLVAAAALNAEDAEIRYNFVVGETVKYLFVTPAQQQQLALGELAITFVDGKRCLIPQAAAAEIKALDPDKLVIFCADDGTGPEPDLHEPLDTGATDKTATEAGAAITTELEPATSQPPATGAATEPPAPRP